MSCATTPARAAVAGCDRAKSRRGFLRLLGGLLAAPAVRGATVAAARPRVVIVGGGWGGLAAAHALRTRVPDAEVLLIERSRVFRSLPLANRWLTGFGGAAAVEYDYALLARAGGWVFAQGEVSAIDRQRREVASAGARHRYDWLVLALGIREDWNAWFGTDRRASEQARVRYAAGFLADEGLEGLARRLRAFSGGTLLMTVPPQPYRCPPAPYERALMIAADLQRRRVGGRVVLLDPNPGMPAYQRAFDALPRERIDYRPQTRILAVDPFAATVTTDVETLRFDEALLAPPQQAADLAWTAGLVGRTAAGEPSGWVTVDPLRLHVPGDDRVFAIGDQVGRVSPLFESYPKTAHMAAAMGRIAAEAIAAQIHGKVFEPALPDSACLAYTGVDPPEAIRIATSYRVRGDGVLEQKVQQVRDNHPDDADRAMIQALRRDRLGLPD
jgi:NADH dehydrogenase FAD-containing subunit